jgi:hypothetical protein
LDYRLLTSRSAPDDSGEKHVVERLNPNDQPDSRNLLLLASGQLGAASATLLDKGAVHLEMDMIMLDLLSLIPSARPRKHLRGFEAITGASL